MGKSIFSRLLGVFVLVLYYCCSQCRLVDQVPDTVDRKFVFERLRHLRFMGIILRHFGDGLDELDRGSDPTLTRVRKMRLYVAVANVVAVVHRAEVDLGVSAGCTPMSIRGCLRNFLGRAKTSFRGPQRWSRISSKNYIVNFFKGPGSRGNERLYLVMLYEALTRLVGALKPFLNNDPLPFEEDAE